jgi:hypothetical protein
MIKQIVLPILAVAVFIIAVGVFVQKSSSLGLSGIFSPQPSSIPEKSITINSTKINVQIADTPDKRAKGLSGTTSLKEGSGMLFVFDTKGVTPLFWMKDMLIPIDIIWIGSGKIVRIDKNVPIPAPGTPDDNLKTYSTGAPIDYVLEVNAGFSEKNKINVGDGVELSSI